ncbi:hypothetical protein [Hoeflea sp. BAL378]|uniref:hypothetical protein n=1 Tax=Hoeflea sp. BAL378 TaxID=1547437 RepID=UPI0009DF614C|nr:hypothetical protein [Hoeflea sp. BAL378]
MKTKLSMSTLLVAGISLFAPMTALAQDAHVAPVKEFISKNVETWLTDPVVIAAIKEQNATTAGLDEAGIDKLDKEWRAQATATARPMVDEVLGRELSKFLMAKKDASQGMITEMFVMDAKGLNVGQSDVTSDYWQGDEAKWQKTFSAGPGTVFVDGVETDESTQALQSQASITITDPETGQAIGAITVGINLDML